MNTKINTSQESKKLKPVAIVYDACSYERNVQSPDNIYLIPQYIQIDDQEFKIDHNLSEETKDIIRKKFEEKSNFKTSQSKYLDKTNLYNKLLEKYENVIILAVNSKVSGEFDQTKRWILNQKEDIQKRVHAINTRTGGAVVFRLAQTINGWIKQNHDVEHIVEKLIPNYLKNHALPIFIDQVKWLHSNGKAGKKWINKKILSFFKFYLVLYTQKFPSIKCFKISRQYKTAIDWMFDQIMPLADVEKKYVLTIGKSWNINDNYIDYIKTKAKNKLIEKTEIVDMPLIVSVNAGDNSFSLSLSPIQNNK